MRIVSLLPSATEIVCALGRRVDLVGRSEECDTPPDVLDLPVVMRARAWDADRPSAEVDARVQRTRASGESLYTLDTDLLRSLRPDVLLTQDLCGVCSVTEDEVARGCATAGVAPRIVSLSPTSLAQVWESIETVGRSIGAEAGAHALAGRLRDRCAPIRPSGSRPRVAVVEWLDPPILAGLWTPDMIGLAGGKPVGPLVGEAGRRTGYADLARARPDLLVLSPCNFPVSRTRAELVEGGLGAQVEAVHAPLGTWVVDEAYFSRPGPRLADGVALLRSILAGRDPVAPMPAARWWREAVA